MRVTEVNKKSVNPSGEFVLYWMIANRRFEYNFALERAIEWAAKLNKPLLVLEALRAGYPWASDRIHQFVIDGMRDNLARSAKLPIYYYPYLEQSPDNGSGLLEALSKKSCVIVTDEFPCFFLPHMVAAAGKKLQVLLEQVDSNGILPLRATDKTYATAYQFRRFLQKSLPEHLKRFPAKNPFARIKLPLLAALPSEIEKRWPSAKRILAEGVNLSNFKIDHTVGITNVKGGALAAHKVLQDFIDIKLPKYKEERNEPDNDIASGLSPYLHFGHISSHEIFLAVAERDEWTIDMVQPKGNGSKEGWWKMSRESEGFLDELITWREVGYNFSFYRKDYDKFESLPDWAKGTLRKHSMDKRKHLYSLKEFEGASTHDPLWNAAQIQLITEGKIHNYLRMLWGKKIIEWSKSPEEAAEIMIELNNKYALDGRNPNSYTGIFWVLGRFDRPWAPERDVFGTIRYMSSENTARKLHVKKYLAKYNNQLSLIS